MQHVIDNFTSYDLMMLRQDLRARYVESSPDGLADRYGDLIEALIDLYEANGGASNAELLEGKVQGLEREIEDLKDEIYSLEDRIGNLHDKNDALEAENRRLLRYAEHLKRRLGEDDENES